ncbi:MAG: serine/threonine protein kinase [Deltaproteobacteria bacterium]|jgi:serine/threonine-protein kinase|nr:serine/threonine protein kinase [Deltaproteobacteria bacterium]MBW2532063.1 serine/threonine protein kinase [Deltaproteobacteria bacterium]
MAAEPAPLVVDRYELHDAIGTGGMATVHIGMRRAAVGLARVVAVKRMHPHLAANVDFVEMFVDEARVASRIRHANVVPVVDAVADDDELLLVMEYVAGLTFDRPLGTARETGVPIPLAVTLRVMCDALQGLHAAHEATDERGAHLEVVHRDVSPQNLLVGEDGLTRVLDFGIAKAAGRIHQTRTGHLKGNLSYMAPEQAMEQPVDRRADIYTLAVVFWEALVGRRAFAGETEAARLSSSLKERLESPATLVPSVPEEIGAVVSRALERKPDCRFATALEMLDAVEAAGERIGSTREVAQWLQEVAGEELDERRRQVRKVELTGADTTETTETSPSEPPTTSGVEPGAAAAAVAVTPAETASRLRSRTAMAIIVLATAILAAAVGWFSARSAARSAAPPLASEVADATETGPQAEPEAPSETAPALDDPAAGASSPSTGYPPPRAVSSSATPDNAGRRPPGAAGTGSRGDSRPAPDSLLGRD